MVHRRYALRSIVMASAFAMAGIGLQQTTPAWAGGDSDIIVAVTKLTTHLDPMGSNSCIAPGSLDTSLSHAAGLSDIAVCHA